MSIAVTVMVTLVGAFVLCVITTIASHLGEIAMQLRLIRHALEAREKRDRALDEQLDRLTAGTGS